MTPSVQDHAGYGSFRNAAALRKASNEKSENVSDPSVGHCATMGSELHPSILELLTQNSWIGDHWVRVSGPVPGDAPSISVSHCELNGRDLNTMPPVLTFPSPHLSDHCNSTTIPNHFHSPTPFGDQTSTNPPDTNVDQHETFPAMLEDRVSSETIFSIHRFRKYYGTVKVDLQYRQTPPTPLNSPELKLLDLDNEDDVLPDGLIRLHQISELDYPGLYHKARLESYYRGKVLFIQEFGKGVVAFMEMPDEEAK
ncbi:hypothetical protein NP233_g11767 [Leucocoprinus birnbaumii]|uniref:Uncharacterized protein n=1 Tax=Leucocoprinus birnbaumii TaxID=56174 RepID=A0AAD5VFS3_9AGAR|nr:hypothetical protein NP233_g11767 [Leucocoprinus birnbaumii]